MGRSRNPVYHFDSGDTAEALFLKDDDMIMQLMMEQHATLFGVIAVGSYAVPTKGGYLIVRPNDPKLTGVPKFREEAADREDALGIEPESFTTEESADEVLDDFNIPGEDPLGENEFEEDEDDIEP